MKDADCVLFLQWALPQLAMRWPGFRKVRRQVARRIERRLVQLGLPDGQAYRQYLADHPGEWPLLDELCRVTISRFFRDQAVFAELAGQVLPALASRAVAAGATGLDAWSIGCAAGEEPYSLALLWHQGLARRFPSLRLKVLATDADPQLLERGRRACYPASALRELPAVLRQAAFRREEGQFCLAPAFRGEVFFQAQDIRTAMPDRAFDLILCRNLVFTYFDTPLQRRLAAQLRERLRPDGFLVLGVRERLPEGQAGFHLASGRLALYQAA
ncbi:MAG: CheR family methyltransferase [Thermodesulfobacteriota bacterium]